ncbi:MAG: class I SAM-dependent methyltransferase [Verrucomicrobiales bacterium]
MKIASRADLPALLVHRDLTRLGIELGVAGGRYSEHLLRNTPLRRLYSVDMWAGDRGHDIRQCDAATRRLSKYGARSIVLRARFDEALALFDDHALDFAYIDGYAHTGNEADGPSAIGGGKSAPAASSPDTTTIRRTGRRTSPQSTPSGKRKKGRSPSSSRPKKRRTRAGWR